MKWFLDNNHIFRVNGVKDSSNTFIEGATVKLSIEDNANPSNTVFNGTLTDEGKGNYSIVLANDLFVEKDKFFLFTLTVESGSLTGSWSDYIRTGIRTFDD